ncbi:unnamed protein product [Rotaria socialis]|uniref:Uncharacterized protein n=1 Tax=Rotaria socialis TaxID=392032 RepID=A0A820IH43_9BILA|nr:unnamed protein product [Rotaria socialis]
MLVSTTAFISYIISLCSVEKIEMGRKDENELIPFTQNDKQRQYKIFIIGDNSGTSPLLVYDELIDNLQISESYTFAQIKCKKMHNKIILTTTANSIIDKATNIVIPDLNDMNELMSLKQIDIEQIACCFDEISHSQKNRSVLHENKI